MLLRSPTAGWLLLFTVSCVHYSNSARPEEQDLGDADVEIHEPSGPNPEKSLPDKISYSVQFDNGKKRLLQLKRRGLLSDLPIHVVGKGSAVSQLSVAGDADVAFYQDEESRAAITLTASRSAQQKRHKLEGTFYHDGGLYSITHRGVGGRELSPGSASAGSKSTTGGHRVSRVIVRHDDSDNVEPNESGSARPKRSSSSSSFLESLASSRRLAEELAATTRLRQRRQAVTSYTVDLMYVSDYYMYQRVQAWLAGTSLPSQPSDVAREVAIILATAANQVNLIYHTIVAPTWSIGTNLAAIYVVTSPEQSTWENAYTSAANSRDVLTLNVGSALSAFNTWLTNFLSTNALPRADHTALFSGYDIYTVSGGVPNYGVCGYASVARACTTTGNSIVELTSVTLLGQIHAHELGHSLNASHDGSGNTCDSSFGWVMAASLPSPTASNYGLFSPCSIASMEPYVSSKSVCLTTNMASYDTSALEPAYSVPLGMRYTVDDQCKLKYNYEYRACGGATYGQALCTELMCYNRSRPYVSCSSAGRALDGTPCGNNKWCVQGACVYNESAPAGSDTCPIGDKSPDIPIYSDSNLTCATLLRRNCYTDSTALACCATCGSLYNASWPSCPYGDRQDCSALWPYNCNTGSWYARCCEYCESKKSSDPTCPYGDYYTNCASNLPSNCVKYPTKCCGTCAQYYGRR